MATIVMKILIHALKQTPNAKRVTVLVDTDILELMENVQEVE